MGEEAGTNMADEPNYDSASASDVSSDHREEDVAQWPSEGDKAKPAVVRPSSYFLKKGKSRTRSIDKETMNQCRVMVATVLKSAYWDLFTGVVVVSDVVFTCIDIDFRAGGVASPPWVGAASTACLILYVTELVSNLCVRDWSFLKEPGQLTDVAIILSGLLELILSAARVSLDSISLMRILRVVRILRLLRLFRKFALLKELRKLLLMSMSCFKTLFWSFVFCFICMAAWSMLAVEMLQNMTRQLTAEGVWDGCRSCSRSLSTVMDANLLLFKTVVALDEWGKVAMPLIERNAAAAFIFCGSQLTIVFGVLNLIVAVVVDTFAEQRTKDVTSMATELEEENDEELRRLDKMFQIIDGDGDGELSMSELLEGARKSKEFQNRLRVMDIDQGDLIQLFAMLDSDGGGTIDPEEFKQTLARWNFDAKTSNRFIRYALQQLMKDHSRAAEKLGRMEERLSKALYREAALAAKASRRRTKMLRGLRLAQRFRDHRALPAQNWRRKCRSDSASPLADAMGPHCEPPRQPSLGVQQPSIQPT